MTASLRRQMMAYRGPRPCDACNYLERCAGTAIACKDFAHFVHTGEVRRESRVPTQAQFAKTMRAEA